MVPQGLMLSLPFSLFGDFRSLFLGDFLAVVLRPLPWGFGWGCMCEPFVVLFLVILLTNPLEKVLNFGVFLGFGKVVFLLQILRFLLI
jgi:hypothetical protein